MAVCSSLFSRPPSGDLLGPTVRGVVDGVEELLRLPTGCGEQNLIYLGPNVYTLRYLKAVGRLTSTIEKKARAFIRQGQCQNRHPARSPRASHVQGLH